MSQEKVTITGPDGQTAEVLESSVKAWERNGWKAEPRDDSAATLEPQGQKAKE
jgi:hypothetical protein